jgi:hypothetical protein
VLKTPQAAREIVPKKKSEINHQLRTPDRETGSD